MDEIVGYFLEQPRRLVLLGQALFTAGMMVIVIGFIGLVARTGASAIQRLGQAPATPAPPLAALYPNLWTWWIPETLIGAVPALIVAGVGVWLVLVGRKYLRVYH